MPAGFVSESLQPLLWGSVGMLSSKWCSKWLFVYSLYTPRIRVRWNNSLDLDMYHGTILCIVCLRYFPIPCTVLSERVPTRTNFIITGGSGWLEVFPHVPLWHLSLSLSSLHIVPFAVSLANFYRDTTIILLRGFSKHVRPLWSKSGKT